MHNSTNFIKECTTSNSGIITFKKKLLGKGYGTNCGAILGINLDAYSWVHFALLHCLNKILNFVHHHFLARSLKELGYLL